MVSYEFLGPSRNGGIGTAYTKLAEVLSGAGHDVTLLYTNGCQTLSQPVDHWINHYRERGMRFVPLPSSSVKLNALTGNLVKSHCVYEWLREHDGFDIVHFPESNGHGYYALAGRRQGLILQNATTIVGLHGSAQWVRVASERLACWEPELEDDFLERRSAELADVVWSPGQYMLGWVQEYGWKIPNSTHIHPYIVFGGERMASDKKAARPVREIVFFGRQEVRKGLLLFLAAIDDLARSLEHLPQPNLVVTILGKPTDINGQGSEQIIRDRSRHWPFEVRVLPDRNEEQALEYLQGEGRLAVMPSLIENYPNTVLECLAHCVPFLASRVGGIPEQIATEDLTRVCFEPKPHILAKLLLGALRRGHVTAGFAFDPDQSNEAWVGWHEQLHAEFQSRRAASVVGLNSPRGAEPTIAVCITHHGRLAKLREALFSILDQKRPPVDVVVAAYGDRNEEVHGELDVIEREFDFAGRGWRLLRLEDRYLGVACNRAATEAKGDFLFFVDEDGIAKPDAVATFAAVASRTDADVLTCLIDINEGSHPPGVHAVADHRRLYAGANRPLSVLHNTFGDRNSLFRRSAFLAAGGFSEELERGQEDWELFVRLMVRGYQIAVIPEALFWRRTQSAGGLMSTPEQENYLRILRSHLESLPPACHTLLELMIGQSLAKRVVVAPAVAEPSSAEVQANPPVVPPPLRYRVVDALNVRLKRAGLVHQIAKRFLQGLVRARRMMRGRISALRSPNSSLALSTKVPGDRKAQLPPHVVRHAGLPLSGQLGLTRNAHVGRNLRAKHGTRSRKEERP